MKKASILVIWFIITCAGCESDDGARRSAATPTPSADGVISDTTSAKGPAEAGNAKETLTSSRLDQALELHSGIYAPPFDAARDELMRWCADNHMAVANATEKDIKEAARQAVARIGDLKEAYDFEVASVTPLEQELLKLAQGYADIGNEIERAKVAAAQEKLDVLKNPTVSYEGQKYYLGQVHKGLNAYLDNERKVCTDDRICKTAYALVLTPTEKTEKMKSDGLRMLFVFLLGDVGEEYRTYATFAWFGQGPERSASTQFDLVLRGLTEKYGTPASVPWRPDSMTYLLGTDLASSYRGSATAWAQNLLLLGENVQNTKVFCLFQYDPKAATRISKLHSMALADFEKSYREKKNAALAQVQQNF
jgi:hypothetical protein